MKGKGDWRVKEKKKKRHEETEKMDTSLIAEMKNNKQFKKGKSKEREREKHVEKSRSDFSNIDDFDVESDSGSSDSASPSTSRKGGRGRDRDRKRGKRSKGEFSRACWCCFGLIWFIYLLILLGCTVALSTCFWLVSGCAAPLCFLGFTIASFLIVQVVFCPIFCLVRIMKKRKKLRMVCFVVELALVFILLQLLLVLVLPTSSVFADIDGNIPGSSDSLLGSAVGLPLSFPSCNFTDMIDEAKTVFGDCIDFSKVRVVYGGIPRLLEIRPGGGVRAMGIDSTVMVASNCISINTFIHEMAHVMEFQQKYYFYDITGPKQLIDWFIGQSGDRGAFYDYYQLMIDGAALRIDFRQQFNMEQLASLVADSYSFEQSGQNLVPQMRYYMDQIVGPCFFP